MSTPAGDGAAARATASTPSTQAAASPSTTPDGQTPGQPTTQSTPPAPAPQQRASVRRPEPSSTPRLLRLARAGAAAAALLTGIVATGTFSTDGLNATPNVIAGEWAAAEQARVDIPRADLLAAERLTGGPDGTDLEAYDEVVRAVTVGLSRMGDGAGVAAGDWSTFVTGVERSAAESSTSGYAEASAAAVSATEQVAAVADEHAADLLTGSRSTLTTVVGTLGVLVLVGILVWLALRTRRIVNIPLVIATLITGGLTWISVNPGSLPLDYDQYVEDTRASTRALQEVYQARTAQVSAQAGLTVDETGQVAEATDAIARLDLAEVEQAWGEATDGGGADAQRDSAYERVETALTAAVREDLAQVRPGVSSPAVFTAAGALLMGLLAAGLAWAGVTQRLRDYR